MIVIIDVLRKTIRIESEELSVTSQDYTWIPSDVTHVRWYGTEGQIQYIPNGEGSVRVESITELGLYGQAIEMFNNEKQIQQEKIEEARDYWAELRAFRDQKLFECDWTQIPDAPLTEEQKTAWGIYRQALRDLPTNTEDPKNPVWPTKPS